MKTLLKKSLLSAAVVSTAFVSGAYQSTFAASTNYVSSYNYEITSSNSITLSSNSIEITEAGEYNLQWTLSDWQVVVNVWEDQEVILNLNGVNITSKSSSAFYVQSGKATIVLVDGTVNYLTDTSNYENQNSDEEPDATLFAKEDLKIKGSGKLVVDGNYNDAIKTKDDLKLKGGTIVITSVDDGIVGNDSIEVDDDVTLDITSDGDGLKSTNEDEGTILIEGGDIDIDSGDDGIKAYSTLTIEGGDIDIEDSVEGLEAEIITINAGDVNITSSDDGINATSSDDNANEMQNQDGVLVQINGGTIVINASGDGLDSNGDIEMTGGDVTVHGPTNNGNGALDYNGTFDISGGQVVAFGMSRMAQSVSSSSSQDAVKITLSNTQSAGTTFTLLDSNGNTVYEATSKKSFNSVVISTADLDADETYTYELNGTEVNSEITTSTDSGWGNMWGWRGGNMQGGQRGMQWGPDMHNMSNEQREEFETMRTLMDKKRNGETLTSEEQAKLTEFEANRPQRNWTQNTQNIQNNPQSFGLEKKSGLGNNRGSNPTSQSSGNLSPQIQEKIDQATTKLVEKISDYDTDAKIKVLENILEKIGNLETKYASHSQAKSLFSYFENSIKNIMSEV